MKKLLVGLVLGSMIASSAAPLAASGDQTTKKVAVAPADEYFGRMKMSILGIRNEIHDLTLKIGYEPAKAESFLGTADMTEDALKDWQRKYPNDPWLPKTLFALERMYSVVHWSNEMNTRALRVMTYVRTHYATTFYGKQAIKEMAAGEVGKFMPTPAPVVATPAP